MSRDEVSNRIAIVGLACRLPGACDPAELWRNLRGGVESIRFFSDAELRAAGVAAELLADPRYVKARAVLADVEMFDAAFFGFSPRVAEVTDPQQRIFLECAWECLENAGYDPARYRGEIGVFAGTGLSTYLLANLAKSATFAAVGTLQTAIGNRTDHLAPMVAYKLDLRGPAVTVQTTCSTSLVAVHLGCQSLLNYECDMVLAGGVSIEAQQQAGYLFVDGGIGSPDGHCRPFDAAAQGTLSGSGCGVVLLKRLEDALAAGDVVRAVIRGSAVNNDGANKIGYTAPSDERQARVIALAQAVAGVHPEEISYIETHGTATPLGDMIEIAALNKVFRAKTARRAFCALGAVKSNFGHLDTAAGVAGLLKTVLALEQREIPPTLHFARPNPEIGLDDSPFFVPAALREWPSNGAPRRAGVSSFGIGGTNAHVVLEEAPQPAASSASRPWQLLLLSARSGGALHAATEQLRQHLAEHPDRLLADVAHTLQVGRRGFSHRRAALCRDDPADARELLASLDPTRVYGHSQEPRPQPVIFLFPGQGAQVAGMGRRLHAAEPEFRHWVDHCCEVLQPLLGFDLRAALWEEGTDLCQTALAQPALFVVAYAMARLWMSWGIAPAAMLGHSLGEYVAACLADVFSLADALRLVAARGRLIQALPAGAMLAVYLTESAARAWLSPEIALAAVNRPSLCVLSGPLEPIDRIETELTAQGVVCRRLKTSHAFHSAMMEPALAAFREAVRAVERRPPSRPYVSNLTGTWIRAEEATDPEYWVRHLRETVRFAAGAELLLRETEGLFLEVGPGVTLANLVRQHPAKPAGRIVLSSLRHVKETDAGDDADDAEDAALLAALGRLWLAGIEPDWQGFYAHEQRRRVELPTYPFERQRYWCEAGPVGDIGDSAPPVRRPDPADWFYAPSWRRSHLVAPPAPEPGERWLVFSDGEGLSRNLEERLASRGHEVVRVEAGPCYAALGPNVYQIALERRQDYESLLAELARRGPLPRRLLHLWTVSLAAANPADPAQQREQLARGFHSLICLAQALGSRTFGEGTSLDVVSTNAYEVVGGDLWWPEKAALRGPLGVLPKELPGLRCRGIDLAAPRDDREAAACAELLLAEILAPGTAGRPPLVAHRGAHRWLPDFVPLPLPSAATPLPRLRPGGSYLITGGLGGIGLTLAEELARTAQARLTLLARTPLPPRDEWDGWLARHGEEEPTSRKLRRLLAIEALGADVLVAAADVADEGQVRAAVAAARGRFGAVHGVIHAAGTSTGSLLQLRSPELGEEVLAPKIQGTRALAAALQGSSLDFFVLCSSRSALLGQAGGADYAAANAFLDAFAAAGRAEREDEWGDGLVAIDWCAWRDVGMLAEAARQAGQPAARGARPAAVESEDGDPTPHPLLERLRTADGRGVYHTRFSADRLWVANEHRIAGHPVVPGTTYLEMARAACEQRTGAAAIELHDVFFLTPVRLRDDEERLLRLAVEPEGDGFAFRVANRAASDSWQETMLGRMRPLPPTPRRRYDLATLRQRCDRRQVLAVEDDERVEDLGPRWQNVKQVYVGADEVLGAVELAPELSGDLEQYRLHPAMLDRAAGLGEQFLIDLTQGFYLPLSYASLKIHAPLPRRIYSWVRLRDSDYTRQETLAFDVVLMDEDGVALVEIEGYSKKRVNNAVEQLRGLAAAAPEVAGDGAYARVLALGITPEEGREVFRRVLAHRVPPQIVISPSDLAAMIAEASDASPERLLAAAADRAAERSEEHERPTLGTPYTAPASELESRLAALWQEALGVQQVGIDDNFFELGGDSVLGIQVVARAKRQGLEISPGQLFELQTIRQLARAVETGAGQPIAATAPREETAPVAAGEVPMTPNQRRFFARGYADPHRLNVTQLFEVHAPLDWWRLASLLPRLTREHDALRLRYHCDGDGGDSWRQVLLPTADAVPFAVVDLAALPAERQSAAVETVADSLQGSLHLSAGPLVRLAACELGAERPGRLLFLGHHLVLDHISVYILAEDLAKDYEAATTGRSQRSPVAASTSFQAWAERLQAFADSAEMEREARWWLSLPWERTARLPRDHPGGENTGLTRRVKSLCWDPEQTRVLLDELPLALGASIEEILLTAAAWALAEWTGSPVQLLQRVVHGRISPFPDLEVARTVGWFAADHPVVLDLAGADSPRQALTAVVQHVRGVPRDGIGFGLLRYCAERPELAGPVRALPTPEVSFNYLGRQGPRRAKGPSVFRDAAEATGTSSDPRNRRPSLLNVSAFVSGDRLRIDWTYSDGVHAAATLERLAAACASALGRLMPS